MSADRPFLSFYTPTFRRPAALAACLASVGAQTAVNDIEHVVVPDHVGLGVAEGLYGRLPRYVDALHGRYVHLLADDDVLAAPDVVARVRAFAEAHGQPPVIVVKAHKAGLLLPCAPLNPPVCGGIDLGCLITRADVWRAHVGDYGLRYEGDYDFAHALWAAGYPLLMCDLHFLTGDARRGAAEVAA